MSVSIELLLLVACRILPVPEPIQTPQADRPAAPAAPVKAPVSAPEIRWAPRAVQREQALIWVEPDVRRQTAGVLRRGQLVLIGGDGPSVAWRDGTERLVQARAAGMEGWMLASDLRDVDFPAWAGALGGAHDPFENPSNLCGPKAAKPWAGGEFEILRVEGDQAIYEAGCMERPDEDADGGADGGSLTPSKRKGSAPLLDFMLLREVKTCMQRLESTGNRSDSLRRVWPQEPALCNVLKIEQIQLPGSRSSWRIDLDGGDHPAEGFVVDGSFLPTPLSGIGKRVFDGPDYTLWLLEAGGRLKVIRLGTAPPSVLEVLDRPLTGEEVTVGGQDGNITGGGTACTWLPGRRQFYICN